VGLRNSLRLSCAIRYFRWRLVRHRTSHGVSHSSCLNLCDGDRCHSRMQRTNIEYPKRKWNNGCWGL
jgi:hypothetical protein